MKEQYEEYFAQTDADGRRALLDSLEASEGQTKDLALCRRLWQMRYEDPKSGRRVDLFLWELVELLCLYSTAGVMKKGVTKDAGRALAALGVRLPEARTEDLRWVIYEELCSAVRLYLKTCESKSYRRRLFGLSELKEEDRQRKVARDMWRLSEGLPRRLGMEADFALLSQAVRDTFCARFEDGERLLQDREERDRRGKNKKQ